MMHVKWNPDFSNLQGKQKLVQKIGDSKKSWVKLQRLTEEGKQLLVRLIGRVKNWDPLSLITYSYLNQQHIDPLLPVPCQTSFGEREVERKITQCNSCIVNKQI